MSVASLVLMFARARMPHRATPFLSFAVVMAFATCVKFQLIRPLADGVRFADCSFLVAMLTVVVTTRPPWNALPASMSLGVEFVTSTVRQVTQTSVARYFPFVGPATGLAAGNVDGQPAPISGVVGRVLLGAVFACSACVSAGF